MPILDETKVALRMGRILCVRFARCLGTHAHRVEFGLSLVADAELHEKKVSALYLPEEFIFLTPLDLAASALFPPSVPAFQEFPWTDFWASLGGKQDDVR